MWTQEQNPGMEQLCGEGAMAYDKRAPHAWDAVTWLPCRETGPEAGLLGLAAAPQQWPTDVSRDLAGLPWLSPPSAKKHNLSK